jgi:hypothetical protein
MDRKVAVVTKTRIVAGDEWNKAYKITVTLELHDIGQGPYFAATAETWRKARNNHYYYHGGGADHVSIAKHFPEFAKYLKWHLVSWDNGPVYYKANAAYWAGLSGWCDGKPNSPPNADHFRKTVVYGAVKGEDSNATVSGVMVRAIDLNQWLDERYPALMEAFKADMRELFAGQDLPE